MKERTNETQTRHNTKRQQEMKRTSTSEEKRMNEREAEREEKMVVGSYGNYAYHTSYGGKKIDKLQPPTNGFNGFKVHICIEIMNADKYTME